MIWGLLSIFYISFISEICRAKDEVGLCLRERRKFTGTSATLRCAPSEAADVYKHLKNHTFKWKAQSAIIVRHGNFSHKIESADLTTTGAFQCAVTGSTDDGEESYIFYHYVILQRVPKFFAVHRTTSEVSHCLKRTLKYAQMEFNRFATNEKLCKFHAGIRPVMLCRKRPRISCEGSRVVIDFVEELNEEVEAQDMGKYLKTRQYEIDSLKDSTTKMTQQIQFLINLLPRLKTYLNKPNHTSGIGYKCTEGFFSEKGNMDYNDALGHGMKPLPLVFCMPCPAGTFGARKGKCKYCQQGYFNHFLGQSRCYSCPYGSRPRFTGAKSTKECLWGAPPTLPEYPEPCVVQRMKFDSG